MKCKNRKHNKELATRKLYILTVVGFVLLFIPVVSFLIDPQFRLLLYMTRIAVGTKFHQILLQENFGINLQVYVFNITNAEAFLSGEDTKLRVKEVGPFTYQDIRKNDNFEIDEELEVMRYIPNTRTEFRPHQSIDDPRLFNVTIPNTALLAMTSMLSSYPYWTKTAFSMLTNRLQAKPIINTDVHSLLWGYDEPLIKLSNTIFPGWVTFDKLGILDRLYDTSSVPLFEVSIANEDKFKLKKIDGCPGLKVWGYENPSKRTRCNTLVDSYEGYAYRPKMTPDSIRLYRSAFCRLLDLEYIGTKSTDISPEVFVYQISKKAYSIDPSTECLCGNMDQCIDGISDISPCFFGLGAALSHGHFLNANPKIYERIEGIHPDEKEHGSEFLIESTVGAVIGSKFTVQVNIVVKNIQASSNVKPFSNMVVPLAYIKIEQPKLSEEDQNNIRKINYVYPYIIHSVEGAIFIAGLLILIYVARRVHYLWFSCVFDMEEEKENTSNIVQEEPLIDEKGQVVEVRRLDIYSLNS